MATLTYTGEGGKMSNLVDPVNWRNDAGDHQAPARGDSLVLPSLPQGTLDGPFEELIIPVDAISGTLRRDENGNYAG